MSFNKILRFEQELAEFTGAPYAIMTDCCTHAIEMCLRYDKIKICSFTPYTYLSIPMTMHKLGIEYSYFPDYLSHRQQWVGEYKFEGTRIWDSARRLERNMYRPGQLQCLSFGHGKPLSLGKCGAILTDDVEIYDQLSMMRSDGRDLRVIPWEKQLTFKQGYHYCPTLETCYSGIQKLPTVNEWPKYHQYPDLRDIDFLN